MTPETIDRTQIIGESWPFIPGYEGLYKISQLGIVLSVPKKGRLKGKIIKSSLDQKGYLKILLCKNKIHKTHRIHNILLKTYVENPQNKPQGNHKNGIKTDNRLSNLEWATHQENNQHAQDTGLNLARFSKKQKEAIRKTGLKNKGRTGWNKGKKGLQTAWNKGDRQSHCNQGHPFSKENTYSWKGKQICKICRRKSDRRRDANSR